MENNPDVFTFSMHGGSNYPFHKEKSDLDVELENGTKGESYLALLAAHLPKVIDAFKPDFAFYLAGVDILDTDKFGKLQVSLADCKKRDEFVFTTLKQQAIPVAVALGGGYSPDIKVIVEAHCNTFRLAVDLFD
jgi:acetoin utilization deacetylase AcuC-like enzyme